MSFRASDRDPIGVGGEKGAEETGGHVVVKKQFGGKIKRHGMGAAVMTGLRKDPGADFAGKLPIHRPERETDAIPAEVAEATEGFEGGIGADVGLPKIVFGEETEVRGDAPDFSDGCSIVERVTDAVQARVVHEHHAVHELHAIAVAGFEHFAHVGNGSGAGLFAKDVFAVVSGAQDPFLAEACGKRDIDDVHARRSDEFLVTAECVGHGVKLHLMLALGDELAAALGVTAGDGGEN